MKSPADLLPHVLRMVEGLPRREALVVGVSGGVDSVVLLDLLRRARCKNLIVAHFHHGLRGAHATRDARFVEDLARRHKMTFVLGRGRTRSRARTHRESIEEAARHLRRAFFLRTARRHQATRIFLAHHAGDAAETLLFHLARGSGARGLAGLRPTAPLDDSGITLNRPLLGCTRLEIEHYAAARRLRHCEDESNFSPAHTRNRLRHEVLPALAQAIGFDPVPPIARTADILAAEDDWMESLISAEADAPDLPAHTLRAMPLARQRRLLRAWLTRCTQVEPDFATVERARFLAISSSGPAKMNLRRGLYLRRRAGRIFVERPS